MLNVAEGEPWTDGGWTMVGSKTGSGSKTNQDMAIPTNGPIGIKRAINVNGPEDCMETNGNAMNTCECRCGVDNEHGCVCDCNQREETERSRWNNEYID